MRRTADTRDLEHEPAHSVRWFVTCVHDVYTVVVCKLGAGSSLLTYAILPQLKSPGNYVEPPFFAHFFVGIFIKSTKIGSNFYFARVFMRTFIIAVAGEQLIRKILFCTSGVRLLCTTPQSATRCRDNQASKQPPTLLSVSFNSVGSVAKRPPPPPPTYIFISSKNIFVPLQRPGKVYVLMCIRDKKYSYPIVRHHGIANHDSLKMWLLSTATSRFRTRHCHRQLKFAERRFKSALESRTE